MTHVATDSLALISAKLRTNDVSREVPRPYIKQQCFPHELCFVKGFPVNFD
jgi:hypothetical protein